MKTMPKKIEIITYYDKDDEEIICEYVSVEILIDAKCVKKYGDYYFDKGSVKADGFIDALRWMYGIDLPEVKYTDKNMEK